MPAIFNFSVPRAHCKEDALTGPYSRGKHPAKALGALAAAAVVLLLTGCGAPQASLTAAVRPATQSATATPTATPDSDKLAAAAAAKAAADKAVADKAAADKAAADKAAADKAAADTAAAATAARKAAEAKAAADKAAADKAAADKAAADKAAADAAAKAAAPPAPVAPAVPGTNPGCDPNYSGCVPIASDVDCAGGSGNGPAYVRGPIQVTGRDIYGLDADHDGIACER